MLKCKLATTSDRAQFHDGTLVRPQNKLLHMYATSQHCDNIASARHRRRAYWLILAMIHVQLGFINRLNWISIAEWKQNASELLTTWNRLQLCDCNSVIWLQGVLHQLRCFFFVNQKVVENKNIVIIILFFRRFELLSMCISYINACRILIFSASNRTIKQQ